MTARPQALRLRAGLFSVHYPRYILIGKTNQQALMDFSCGCISLAPWPSFRGGKGNCGMVWGGIGLVASRFMVFSRLRVPSQGSSLGRPAALILLSAICLLLVGGCGSGSGDLIPVSGT